MRIALVDSNRSQYRLYPLGLLKIGAYLKKSGHTCRLFDNCLPYHWKCDEIWISTIFTFQIPYVRAMIKKAKQICDKIKIGGISATLLSEKYRDLKVYIHKGLYKKAENCIPDYNLLEAEPEYSISYTSRGCIRKCGFCMVRKLEPEYFNRKWQDDVLSNKKLLFYDNNWLAKGYNDIEKDYKIMKEIVKTKNVKEIDFNQALDARLITDKIAKLIGNLPIKPVRFSFDGLHEDGYVQRAVQKLVKFGKKLFTVFILYNFKDKVEDFYYRLKEVVKLSETYNVQAMSFPMRY